MSDTPESTPTGPKPSVNQMTFKNSPTPKDFLPSIRQHVKETLQTGKETGFSVGLVQTNDGIFEAHFYRGVSSPKFPSGELIPRPPAQEQALMHFHTHVEDDDMRGLSIMDVLFPAFQNGVYNYYVVANTALNEVNVYESSRVMKDPEYSRVIEKEKKLATDAAISVMTQSRGREPPSEYMNLLNQNKVAQAASWLKSHGYVQAAKILEQYFREWNSFMNKTRTTVYPINETR